LPEEGRSHSSGGILVLHDLDRKQFNSACRAIRHNVYSHGISFRAFFSVKPF
jgi:hypothetical protein